MFKTLKFSGDESNFFFVSDIHHGHDRDFIYKKRGYNSVQEHDAGIIEKWNSVCDENSIVFNLGDPQFNDPDGSKFLDFYSRVNFRDCYMLIGNHVSGHKRIYADALKNSHPSPFWDLGFELYPTVHKMSPFTNKVIYFLPQYVEITINKNFIVLCHYPIYSHNEQENGSYMLCGHSHGSCPLTNKNTGKGRRLDVGVESFGRPINFLEVGNWLKDRDVDCIDHHNENTK